MRCVRISIAIACMLSVMAQTMPAIAGSFDGKWAVSTQSNRSNCGGNTNELTVSGGQVSGEFVGNNGVYTARGTISEAGKVRFNLDAGYVVFKGDAEGDTASGRWTAGQCRGRFQMTRE